MTPICPTAYADPTPNASPTAANSMLSGRHAPMEERYCRDDSRNNASAVYRRHGSEKMSEPTGVETLVSLYLIDVLGKFSVARLQSQSLTQHGGPGLAAPLCYVHGAQVTVRWRVVRFDVHRAAQVGLGQP